ncbi:MAG TPA: DUF5667 domain-containing protein [Candidatus Bipolaricaulota bacterium]|nr:DUF5667 domain-containing protein [Candidatus Bipolaricaulota bacterium]
MTDKDIIKQLKSLRILGANAEWKKSNRNLLISQIKGQTANTKESAFKNFWYGIKAIMPGSVKTFVYKPIGAITLIVTFIFGASVFGVSASKGTVPGDTLYKVKLTSEKIYAGLTVGADKKTDLYMGYADERMNEMDKLQLHPEVEGNQENMKVAIHGLTEQMTNVKEQLEKVKLTPKPAQEIVDVAKKVDDKVDSLSEKIKQKKKEIKAIDDKSTMISELDAAQNVVEETSEAAIGVIIEKHVSGEVESSVEEIAQNLEGKIRSAEEKIEEVKNVSQPEETCASCDAMEDASSHDLATEDVLSDNDQLILDQTAIIGEAPEEVQKLVEEARLLLQQGDITRAFEKIKESNLITRDIQTKLGAMSESTGEVSPDTTGEPETPEQSSATTDAAADAVVE